MAGILLLGAAGQLGQELIHALPQISPLNKLHALDHHSGNILIFQKMEDAIEKYQPNVIINAAAYTAVDQAQEESEKAFATNAKALEGLAQLAQQHQALLVHFSTDYVFDGQKKEAYVESDSPNPQNVYGQSKWQGEQAILKSGCRHLILRTSWVFGYHGNNFVKTILRLAQHNENLKIVCDQIGCPTSARFLAQTAGKAIFQCLENPEKEGLYHLSNSRALSWFDFANCILNEAQALHFPIQVKQIEKITSANFPQKATRPPNSVLNCNHFKETFHLDLPAFDSFLKELLAEIKRDF